MEIYSIFFGPIILTSRYEFILTLPGAFLSDLSTRKWYRVRSMYMYVAYLAELVVNNFACMHT